MWFFTWVGLSSSDDGPVRDAAGAFPRCVCLPSLTSAVPWLQDPYGNWFLVDTGAPRTQLTTWVAGLPTGEYLVADGEVAELVLDAPLVVSDALPEDLLSAAAEAPIGGLIGADVLLRQPWWRDGEHLYFAEPPEGITLVASVPLELTGGGRTCLEDGLCFEHDATRLIVDAEIEGRTLTLLVDTGATWVTISGAAADGIGMERELPLVEAAVRVGEFGRDEVLVARADDELEEALVVLSTEVGRPVDGLLGQSLLEGYVVGISDQTLTFSTRP